MAPRTPFIGLEHWSCFSPGYALDLEEASGPVRHAFCGTHEIPGAWCFFGDHSLLRFLSLDTRDERLGLAELGVPHVHLLYCWRCDVGRLDYRLERDGGVTLLGEREWIDGLRVAGHDPDEIRARLRDPATDYPYPDYPAAFPLRDARLRPVDAAAQAAIVAAERDGEEVPPELDRARHQVGGLPYLVQGSSHVPRCGDCGKPMAFVASIADDCADPRGFTSNEGVQVLFFLCPACRRVNAFNVCD